MRIRRQVIFKRENLLKERSELEAQIIASHKRLNYLKEEVKKLPLEIKAIVEEKLGEEETAVMSDETRVATINELLEDDNIIKE